MVKRLLKNQRHHTLKYEGSTIYICLKLVFTNSKST